MQSRLTELFFAALTYHSTRWMSCGLRLKKQKKVKHNSPAATQEGNVYIYTTVKRNSYLFVAFAIGKLTQQTCSEMLVNFKCSLRPSRKGEKVEVFTDGNYDYTYALPNFFVVKRLNYAQLLKIRDTNGRLIRKEINGVYGSPDCSDAETVNVENFNSILREQVGRLARKSKCFSKKAQARMRFMALPVLLELHLTNQKTRNATYDGRLRYSRMDMTRVSLLEINPSNLEQCQRK